MEKYLIIWREWRKLACMLVTENRSKSKNIYTPSQMRIVSMHDEAPMVRTFKLEFLEQSDLSDFQANFRTGMFGLYGIYGEGECTFCVASPETQKDFIECTFRKAGRVTSALYSCDVGDIVSFRGPYGNRFPIEDFEGKNLLFVSGGIGLAPTRSVINTCLDHRGKFEKITILYGAKTVDELIYKQELELWKQRDDVDLILTVDPGGESAGWDGESGFVPAVLQQKSPSSENCIAIVCGPPIMIKFTLMTLSNLRFASKDIYTTLENRMKCGVGKCGRCNIGDTYVCKEGPVFTAQQIERLPAADF